MMGVAKVSSLKLFYKVSSQSSSLRGSDLSTIPTRLVLYIISTILTSYEISTG